MQNQNGIPLGKLIFGFQPSLDWNDTQPQSFMDLTGLIECVVSASWGSDISVTNDGLLAVNKNRPISFTLPAQQLPNGFTVTTWFAVDNLAITNRYVSPNFASNQLAFIYGYNASKLEFYDYLSTNNQNHFRPQTEITLGDTSRHFAAISYDASTGNTIYAFDGNTTTFTIGSITYSLSQASSFIGSSGLKTKSGQTLLYSRPLNLTELRAIYQMDGKI